MSLYTEGRSQPVDKLGMHTRLLIPRHCQVHAGARQHHTVQLDRPIYNYITVKMLPNVETKTRFENGVFNSTLKIESNSKHV